MKSWNYKTGKRRKQESPDRLTLAVCAPQDHGTRDGATARKVTAAMRKEGFTDAEIAAAAEKMK